MWNADPKGWKKIIIKSGNLFVHTLHASLSANKQSYVTIEHTNKVKWDFFFIFIVIIN